MNRLLLLYISLICITFTLNASEPSIDLVVERTLKEDQIPGIAVAVVSLKNDRIHCWRKGYGWADIEHKIPVTPHHSFWLGSVTKLFTGTAIAMAKQEDKINLNESATAILAKDKDSFKIDGPNSKKITLKHLVTHSSGIHDTYNYLCNYYTAKQPGDKSEGPHTGLYDYVKGTNYCQHFAELDVMGYLNLRDFLSSYLSKNSILYQETNFIDSPGEKVDYSNIGTALAGHLLHLKTGMPLNKYACKHIFHPLGMKDTFWHWPVEKSNPKFVVQYENPTTPIPQYFSATWPDGGLRSSVHDLSLFIGEILLKLNGIEGKTKLTSLTVKWMTTPLVFDDDEGIGIFWVTENILSEDVIGHTGGDPGASTFLYINPHTNVGIVILSNTDHKKWSPNNLQSLFKLLFKKGR